MSFNQEMFNNALSSNGYPLTDDIIYEEFRQATENYSMEERAMFLAQLIHESEGFQFIEECRYAEKDWHSEYRDTQSLPNQLYHGRGYIPLTWAANYLAASEALGMGYLLLHKPQLVAERIDIAMKTSKWFWEERVRPALQEKPNCFGVTTKIINEGECGPNGYTAMARSRYKIYLKVAQALGVTNVASECGCYDVNEDSNAAQNVQQSAETH